MDPFILLPKTVVERWHAALGVCFDIKLDPSSAKTCKVRKVYLEQNLTKMVETLLWLHLCSMQSRFLVSM